ncbi:YaaW family protein [Spirulina subsalsa]|uniref:YaaW family protein n=1 Tax=Spirulina subsalsa TaxID=54311 RepID=UPI0002D91E11|nr:hypothetical protein [Spirulina subsalsa]
MGQDEKLGVEVRTLDELRDVLELATDEELQHLTHLLFCRRLNPLDYIQTPDVMEVQSRDRHSQIELLEQRFRYLAADGFTVLRGESNKISYRQVLIQVSRYLKIPYSQSMSTVDLEAEIFLNLITKAWDRLPSQEQESLTLRIQKSLQASKYREPLPAQIQHNPIHFLLKGGSVLAVSSVLRSVLLQQIARQFALHFATYQTARTALLRGGTAAATQIQNHLTLQTARQGMALTAARHGAVRTVFAFMGPVLWAAFFADLGWRAIATNYGRVIPTIFALAQIRLTRGESWGTVTV